MPSIKIQRTKEYINRISNYHIFIDGKHVGAIQNGKSLELEVTPEQHSISAKIDWCGSQPLLFDGSESKTILVGSFKISKYIMPIFLAIMALHFLVQYVFAFDYLILLVLPLMSVLVYYITLGRNKYLVLTEVKSG